jgi:GNAT superfamily N-acetyltransferase
VHAVYAETAAQVPDEAGFVIGYDWFLEHVWNSPAYDHQLSAGGVADGRLVAVSVIRRTGASVWNDMTGTLAAYRGQGLAKVVKWASLRWAADAGCEEARTLNNVRNVPMLTVNDWLGYEETSRSTTVTWTAEPSVG